MQGLIRIFTIAAALAAVPAAAYDGMTEPEDCAPQVAAELSAAGIPEVARTGTNYVKEKTGDSEGVEIGIAAWTRLSTCRSGYVVVYMDLECRPWQTYTFGDCRVSGVPRG